MMTVIIGALAAVLAGTASANDWSLYGSARMGTFWTSEDLGDQTDAFGRDDVDDLKWDLQTNSRIGAKVKGDKVSGRFEYGTSGGNANIRLLYGVWQFTENWGLKVGQDYTPVYFGLSAQAFDNDANLWQTGNAYGGRKGQVALEGLGFKVAAIAPSTSTLDAGAIQAATERKVPKLEASYKFILSDAMSFHILGGWQYYTLLWQTLNQAGALVNNDEDVSSYMVGAGADLGFGPFFVRPQVSWYKNGAAAGWLNTNIGLSTRLPQQTPFVSAAGNDIIDVDSLMAMLAIGFKPTESLGLEAGIGYLASESDEDQGVEVENTYLEYYLQATFTMFPGVYLVPEVGLRDYGDLEETGAADAGLGDLWYAGLKWQIDF
ncbi:MAG: hypothetical protein U5R30_14520 [Deltaproteobacteria bacterium]|nr:hypothetical protein [Deltaproteobacteria bacterium]